MTSVAVSNDCSRVESGSWDRTIRVWDVSDSESDAGSVKKVGKPSVRALAMSRDGKLAVSGNRDGSVYIWDVASHGLRRSALRGHKDSVMSLIISNDNRN